MNKIKLPYTVVKFGGTSVGSADRIAALKDIIAPFTKKSKLLVVCSAVSGITDLLIKAGESAAAQDELYVNSFLTIKEKHFDITKSLFKGTQRKEIDSELDEMFTELDRLLMGVYYTGELSNRSKDHAVSFGERLSCSIINAYFLQHKIKSQYVDARNIIETNDEHGCAIVDQETTYTRIRKYFKDYSNVSVVTGFIASTKNKITTTLGRGGSDYTASILGAALKANEIQIWTDVDGVMTADPRKVKDAIPIRTLTYNEALEMSYFGAKIIYPPTIQPAFDAGIPLRIKNTLSPTDEGTYISSKQDANHHLIRGISSVDKVSLITLEGSGMMGVAGVAARVFSSLAYNKINVILITQGSSEHNITFAVRPEDESRALHAVAHEFKNEIKNGTIEEPVSKANLAILAVIGENMRNTTGVSGKLFQSLGKNGISVIATAQGSSEMNISLVINHDQLSKALNTVHQAFFLSDHKTVHLYLAGVGLIGSKLIEQIKANQQFLKDHHHIQLRIAGLADSKLMLQGNLTSSASKAKDLLKERGEKLNLKKFIEEMDERGLANSIFVDCTANVAVASLYQTILEKSVSIVTPNKIANCNNYEAYSLLKQTAREKNVQFKYETNVGAGLPVINTLQSLMISGDEIIRIEAVLSGTLSYIFNNFNSSVSFSEVVAEAQRLGYTEPDPRDDLSGQDFARKILILARETGSKMELMDVKIKSFLPAECWKPKSVPEFFKILKQFDPEFKKLALNAERQNKVLRVIGSYGAGIGEIKLSAVDASHPFYQLQGSDNIISFTTQRYLERPLVVKGPGAGAEVTAAGVFADIINVSNYLV
jgi:aspartokinase/homoserine dehydrogenase 1